jgi:hypothetical protein
MGPARPVAGRMAMAVAGRAEAVVDAEPLTTSTLGDAEQLRQGVEVVKVVLRNGADVLHAIWRYARGGQTGSEGGDIDRLVPHRNAERLLDLGGNLVVVKLLATIQRVDLTVVRARVLQNSHDHAGLIGSIDGRVADI